MRTIKGRWAALISLLLCAVAIGIPMPAAAQSCQSVKQLSSFDGRSSPVDGFTRRQIQRGDVVLAADPMDATNKVAKLTAGGKKGGKVGKADLIYAFADMGAGSIVTMQARFFFPAGSALDSMILMDLECASCGVDTNPGIRLYLRKGLLRVDRSKIGIKKPMLPNVATLVTPGKWHDVSWEVTLGADAAGRSVVLLDGVRVLDVPGTTILTQAEVNKIAKIKVRERVDRFQVGLTANSNKSEQTVYLDDVKICIR